MNATDASSIAVFPQQVNSVGRVLRQLKKEDSSLFNCACSVSNDADFIQEVAKLYPHLPLVPNLRCGLWYVRNSDPTCYFKSTDGHNGNWSFSTTRLNLHIAELAAANGGCIIVDATRRGKTFPDALTKTIPIWAAVLNRAVAQLRSYHDGNRQEDDAGQADLQDSSQTWDTGLHLPAWISQNERVQIEAKVDQWVRDLVQVTGDVGRIAAVLDKPLRPIWLSQESRMWTNAMTDQASLPFTPLYLVSASKPNPQRLSIDVGKETMSYSYVPGAGDDEESWAKGLTPALFWQHQQDVLAAGPHGVNRLVATLLQGREQDKAKAMLNPLATAASRSSHGVGSLAFSSSNHAWAVHNAVINSKDWSTPAQNTAKLPNLRSTQGSTGAAGVLTDKHHPAPGGLEMSQTTIPAHGLFWIGTSRLALGPAAAAHSSFVWHHAEAVVNASAPSRQEMKASGAPAALQQRLPPAVATAVRDCEALATSDKASPGAYLRVPIASSKLDRHGLEGHLPAALEFVSGHLAQQRRVLLHCDAGDDACVCLAVAVHLACFTSCSNETNVMRFVKPYESKQHPPGTCLLTPDGTPVSKHSIRRVLAIVSRFYPLARPTRGMLKQVFNFFEPPHRLPMPTSTASAPAAVSATAAAAATAAVLFTGDATASAEGADRPKAVLHSDCMAADCTAIAGDRCLTHLTSDASMEADRKSATSMRCGAVRLISPFVAAAEDASQAAFAVPVCSGSDVPDRGTQSI